MDNVDPIYKVVAICKHGILVLNIFSNKEDALRYAEKMQKKMMCKIRVIGKDEDELIAI